MKVDEKVFEAANRVVWEFPNCSPEDANIVSHAFHYENMNALMAARMVLDNAVVYGVYKQRSFNFRR